MRRDKKFKTRKGLNGGARNWTHAYVCACIDIKNKWWMTNLDMRRCCDDVNSKLYGPLNLTMRWISDKNKFHNPYSTMMAFHHKKKEP